LQFAGDARTALVERLTIALVALGDGADALGEGVDAPVEGVARRLVELGHQLAPLALEGLELFGEGARLRVLQHAPDLLGGIVPRVAVTVNATDDELRRILDSEVVDLLQLHGDETPERVRSLAGQGLPVFKAVGVRDAASLESAGAYEGTTLLLDAYAPSDYGGTGETMDWALGAEAVTRFPDREIVLAGGLTPGNVASAVRQVRPAGVDDASGVESSPGVKDPDLVRRFVEAAAAGG